MAKVEFVSKAYNAFGGYFGGLNCPLIVADSSTSITIDGKLNISTTSYQVIIKWDGTTITSMSCNFPHSLEVYYSDTFFYVQGADPQSRRWYAVYEKIGNTVLYAGYCTSSTGTSRIGFNSITLTDPDTSNTYVHGTVFNYPCDAGYIDYADTTALFSNGYKKMNDTNFKPCSTVTQGNTITIAGSNYYAVSEHDLLLLD